MTWKVDFRNHIDTLGSRIVNDFTNLLLSIPHSLAVWDSVCRIKILLYTSAGTERTDRSEFRIFLDLNSPALVIGKMPVEGIEFMHLHDVEISLHLFHTEEVTRLIKVKTSIAKTWSIIDRCAWHNPLHTVCSSLLVDLYRKHLLDGLDRIVETTQRRSLNDHSLPAHFESIGLSCDFRILNEDKTLVGRALSKSAFL